MKRASRPGPRKRHGDRSYGLLRPRGTPRGVFPIDSVSGRHPLARQETGASPCPRTPFIFRATSLDAAVDLARGCPILRHGGAVEVGELTNHDDRFDERLAKHVSR